ncbi:uncharacterized protein [Chironomus tepperi]|uniref:uncharacterized protein n=1 Tax=Chironomus tepperi TaxID=113505 RepID=UPI00391EE34A
MAQNEMISLTERFLESNRNTTIISMNQDDMHTREYRSFKSCLRRSYYKDSRFSSRFSMKQKINLFNRTETTELNPFERILTSNEDKSAIISLTIRSYNLCSDEEFWTKVIDLENVMRHYAINEESNIKNLFSILLYDWHNHEPTKTKKQTEYILKYKFDAYRKSGNCLFVKLFDIIDNDQYQGYHHVCLRIIYQYLHERNLKIKSYQEEMHQESEINSLQSVIYQIINNALSIKNKEYKNRILKILTVFLRDVPNQNYEELKFKILDAVKYKLEVFSSYHIAIESISKHCDEKFFHLVFQLKENFLKNFEFAFEDYIQIYRKYYGEYWKVAMKENARLLYHVAEEQCERRLLKTVEFIFNHCSFIELNSTILTSLQQVDEFYVIFNEPLDEKEKDFLVEIEKLVESSTEDQEEYDKLISEFLVLLRDKRFTRNLLFGRNDVDQSSVLEKILQNSEFYDLLEEIWKHFQLFEKPDILLLKNPLGNYLMQYALKATSFNQFIGYLMLQSYQGDINFKKPKQYMIMQNALYYSLKGESIIESQVHINLNDEQIDGRFFSAITYFLEEIGTINEIENDAVIDYFLDIIKSYENFSKDMFEIDDLLGFIIAYWNPQGKMYQEYKEVLTNSSPFYELLFMIVEKKSKDFIQLFPKKIGKLEETYKTRYNIIEAQQESEDNLYELYTSNLIYVLFFAAIKNKQRKIIECIFNNDSFVTIQFEFPPNMKAQEIHYYAALTFLNRKHELGRSNIPKDWLTQEVLEEFLNSRINYYDKDLVEIDCTSMLHAQSQKTKVKCKSDIDKDILMLEDRNSLEYIKENENLKEFIAHPVVETYINLKSFKYQRIFVFNFWIFVILYILPFLLLIARSHLNGNETLIKIYDLFYLDKWHYFGITFLICRETFQCYTSDSYTDYFKQLSNKLDVALIILSILMSVCTSYKDEIDKEGNLRYLEASLILFITINATTSLPSAYVPLNMQILKRVALTFLGLFNTFAIILIAFTLSFFIIFEGELNEKLKNKTETKCCDDDDPVDNFMRLDTSFVKIITMLSGEYAIEPISIDFFQLVFFGIFVISSFILYNLILGLAIENVQDIKNGSRKFILETKAKKLINIGIKLEKYHDQIPMSEANDSELDIDQPISLKGKIANFFLPIVKFSLLQYIYVHSFQKIYVDIKTGEVFINVDQKYEHILKKGHKSYTKFKVSKVTLQEIQDIINVKNKKIYEELKKKISKEEREK